MGESRRPLLKRCLGFLSLGLMMVSAVVAGFSTPVFAEGESSCPEGSIKTSILGNGGCMSDDGSGSGIIEMLTTIVNVMSAGVAILAAVGIAIVGIQYLTAGDNEGQAKKAKQRLFEIVIGIVAYAVFYALLTWLLPGFSGAGGASGA